MRISATPTIYRIVPESAPQLLRSDAPRSPNRMIHSVSSQIPLATPSTSATFEDKISRRTSISEGLDLEKSSQLHFISKIQHNSSQLDAPRWSLQRGSDSEDTIPTPRSFPTKAIKNRPGLLCAEPNYPDGLPIIVKGVRETRSVFRSPNTHNDDANINVP